MASTAASRVFSLGRSSFSSRTIAALSAGGGRSAAPCAPSPFFFPSVSTCCVSAVFCSFSCEGGIATLFSSLSFTAALSSPATASGSPSGRGSGADSPITPIAELAAEAMRGCRCESSAASAQTAALAASCSREISGAATAPLSRSRFACCEQMYPVSSTAPRPRRSSFAAAQAMSCVGSLAVTPMSASAAASDASAALDTPTIRASVRCAASSREGFVRMSGCSQTTASATGLASGQPERLPLLHSKQALARCGTGSPQRSAL
eukprot:342490-Pleurochrysis_carterae.AAC.1